MYPKKSFGQHFLRDRSTVESIIEAAKPGDVDLVVEVGPGLGALTELLAEQAKRLVLIEADRDLLPGLKEKFPLAEVIQADAAKVDYATLVGDAAWVFVSNLPYNAAAAIIMEVVSCDKPPERLIVMVQKEVGERMLAKPGDMGLFSVAIGMYAEAKKVCLVKPGAFVPPPKVDSMVLELVPKAYADTPLREDVIALAKIGFSSRRKQLHRNFADAGTLPSDQMKSFLAKLDLREDIRAEDLGLEHWIALARLVDEYRSGS